MIASVYSHSNSVTQQYYNDAAAAQIVCFFPQVQHNAHTARETDIVIALFVP